MGMFLRRGPAQHRTRMSDLEIGQTIKLNVNGTAREFLVVNQGLPSTLYDASCDGTWLLMRDLYESIKWANSKSNVYESSNANTYLNGPFLGLFDGDIQSAIKQVKIPYRKGGGSGGTDQSGANGLSCKIFLLSRPEIGDSSSNGTGTLLSYFELGSGSSATQKRIAYNNSNGRADEWWTRNPDTNDSSYVMLIGTSGGSDSYLATYTRSIRPAFILPSDFLLTDGMLV